MNDISSAIISYRYYRDEYYVSRGVRSRSFSLVPSLASPSSSSSSLSFSLPRSLECLSRSLSLSREPRRSLFPSPSLRLFLLLLSLETLLLLHAWNQVTALQESKSRDYARERGLVLSNIYLYPPERDDD